MPPRVPSASEVTVEGEKAPAYRRPADEEIVASAIKVILEETSVASLKRFRELVLRELRRHDRAYALGEKRLRALALRTGLIEVEVRTREEGTVPVLSACPVCASPLSRTENRTLAGGNVATGYRCRKCPWWTGRDYRVPNRYAFHAKLEKGGRSQTQFRGRRTRL